MTQDNKSLGRFILDGIPPAPRGMPQVEVTFDIDANGILNVKAKDKASGKEQSIRIEASSGLSKEDIEKMQKDAEMHASDDAKKRELVEAKNLAEQLAYTAEKALKDAGEKVPADLKTTIQTKIDALKKEKDSGTIETIKKASEELSTEMQKIGQYMSQQTQSGTEGAQQSPNNSEQTKDAEFKEKGEEPPVK